MPTRTDSDGNKWMLNQGGDGWIKMPVEQPAPDVLSMGLLQNFGQGATLGFGDELSAGLSAGATTLFGDNAGTFGQEYEDSLLRLRSQQEDYARANPGIALGAEIVGGGLTSAAGIGRVLAKRGLKAALAAGIGEGALYGAGGANPQQGESRVEGALTGGVLGLGGGLAATGAGKIIGRVLDNARVVRQQADELATAAVPDDAVVDSAEAGLQALVSTDLVAKKSAEEATKAGYDLSPFQTYGTDKLRLREKGFLARAGGSPWLNDKLTKNQTLLNQKVGETIGLKGATNLGEANMSTAVDNITDAMGRLTMQDGADRVFKVAPKFVRKIEEIEKDYVRAYGKSENNAVSRILADAKAEYKTGKISAKRIQETHSDAGLDLVNAKEAPDRRAFGALREVMDDIMESNMKGNSRAQWKKLRQQWGNVQTLIRPGVVSKEGAGNVSPFALSNKLRQGNALGFVTGKPDVRNAELSKIAKQGVTALTQSPSSGTAENLINAAAITSPGRGIINGLLGDAQEIPYRVAPQLSQQAPVGSAGILGGLQPIQDKILGE